MKPQTKTETLKALREASLDARELFAEILTADYTQRISCPQVALEELQDLGVLNEWSDDEGIDRVEIGVQQ